MDGYFDLVRSELHCVEKEDKMWSLVSDGLVHKQWYVCILIDIIFYIISHRCGGEG